MLREFEDVRLQGCKWGKEFPFPMGTCTDEMGILRNSSLWGEKQGETLSRLVGRPGEGGEYSLYLRSLKESQWGGDSPFPARIPQ